MNIKTLFSKVAISTVSTALMLGITMNTYAGSKYAEDGYGSHKVINSYGECWESIGGRPDICGAAPSLKDSDGDGVADDKDKCPGTPQGAKVNSYGCEIDSDGDGIVDSRDKCPGTPQGAKVDKHGCMAKLVLQNINFELNSAELTSASKTKLGSIVTVLKSRPDIKGLIVTGHTDSSGADQYNQTLSRARAESVADFFAFSGVTLEMTAKGMGESSPVADNDTAEGRAKNRRVELEVTR